MIKQVKRRLALAAALFGAVALVYFLCVVVNEWHWRNLAVAHLPGLGGDGATWRHESNYRTLTVAAINTGDTQRILTARHRGAKRIANEDAEYWITEAKKDFPRLLRSDAVFPGQPECYYEEYGLKVFVFVVFPNYPEGAFVAYIFWG